MSWGSGKVRDANQCSGQHDLVKVEDMDDHLMVIPGWMLTIRLFQINLELLYSTKSGKYDKLIIKHKRVKTLVVQQRMVAML